MKVKAKTAIKYEGNRYPPGSIFTLKKGDESLAKSKSVEVIPSNEEAEVSSNKKGGDNSDSSIPQRSRKTTKNKGGDGD